MASSTPSSAPLDDESVTMGARIRSLRRERGLTLVQLARLSGMSQPFLSLAERGHARLSLASMARIARALEVPAGSLLARQPERRVSGAGIDVVAHLEPRDPEGERTVWQLAQLPGGLFGTEFWGRDAEFGEYAVHEEDEFLYVLDGVLEVGLPDGTVHPLSPGDTMALTAGTPHAWRSASPAGYRVVTVTAGARGH
ncbi:XRE family transcriptional regulator [Herbiconiux sp. KACC 21604]|uniref:helix-turn-helix domain-containing protein n=1 Tax=unclassified Herbiconiux TaxID=2618217 RepID=UPI00149281BE|nr:XRE family transcriptional regulator [Herbiconiux sp. SALV-R1]QJU53297.1 helix-turn-helix transcriptional regulator [Herbiconiux sp. SALV-R1]WPO88256.1 XRE family transcriptional regulator [Herbiconiux sp. KACC 21604]